MKTSRFARTRKIVSSLACVLGFAIPAQAHAVCHNFNADALVSHGGSWFKSIVGIPTSVFYQAAGGFGPDLEVVATTPIGATRGLRLGGSSGTVHQIDMLIGGAYPTEVDFNMAAFAGAVTVDAYDSSGTLVDSDVAVNNTVTGIKLRASEIAYVILTGGDNEDWIDDVCWQ